MRIITVLAFIVCAPLQAVEYVYPVAVTKYNEQLKIYVNYQSSTESGQELLLWEWDPVTKVVSPVVIPAYTPMEVKLTPAGISFIDKGKIFIKSFNKRSPKSILFYEPIDDIAMINWMDQESFYFMAKHGEHYGVFHGSVRGNLFPIVHSETSDYLYPQKTDEQLFFVRRMGEQYTLMNCTYPARLMQPPANTDASYPEQVDALLKQIRSPIEPLVPTSELRELLSLPEHAAFLTMASATEGFIVSHPAEIEADQALITFGFWRLFVTENGNWDKEQLFYFSLPRSLIMEDPTNNLCESMMPLLPRYKQDVIYYVDANAEQGHDMTTYRYNVKNRSRSQILTSADKESLCFAPLCINDFLFYGGRIRSEDLGTGGSLPAIWINKEGLLCLDLPVVVDTKMDIKAA